MSSRMPRYHRLTIPIVLLWCLPNLAPVHAADEHAADGAHAAADADGKPHEESRAAPGSGVHEDETGEHGEHEAEAAQLTPEQMAQAGILVAEAGPGMLVISKDVSGQITLNADRLAHVVPRVGGVITEVHRSLGEKVAAGDALAVIESRDLADLKADHLAATSRLSLAQATYAREAELWRQRISAEQDYLAARHGLAEARIAERQTRQKLLALGISEEAIRKLGEDGAYPLSRLEITAPIAGVVIEKHATLGESADTAESLFTIADLGTVWVDLSVHSRDLGLIREGHQATVTVTGTDHRTDGRISYVQPLADPDTRSVRARIVLDNSDGSWRPGSFVTASVVTDELEVPVLVPREAVQDMNNSSAVFVAGEHGFEARKVTLGRSDASSVEILDGLKPGERYVSAGSFVVKADIEKAGAAHEH